MISIIAGVVIYIIFVGFFFKLFESKASDDVVAFLSFFWIVAIPVALFIKSGGLIYDGAIILIDKYKETHDKNRRNSKGA